LQQRQDLRPDPLQGEFSRIKATPRDQHQIKTGRHPGPEKPDAFPKQAAHPVPPDGRSRLLCHGKAQPPGQGGVRTRGRKKNEMPGKKPPASRVAMDKIRPPRQPMLAGKG
jgi:hypothetical protein